jgi:hypothetical protein
MLFLDLSTPVKLSCPAVAARGSADLLRRSGLLFLPLLTMVV